jgi:hypothetical protein
MNIASNRLKPPQNARNAQPERTSLQLNHPYPLVASSLNSLVGVPFQSQLSQTERAYFNSELLNSHNVVNSQREARQTASEPRKRGGKHKPLWQRLSEKTATKNRICTLLSELGNHELADNFRACHSRFLAVTCGTHVTERRATFYCGHRACVFCSEIRARERRGNYLPKVAAFASENAHLTPCHVVLTQKHYRGEQLSDSIKRLTANFRKLIRRDFWKNHLSAGGAYAVEFTLGKDGCWHAHLHCLVFRNKFFHVNLFRREWKDTTGDSVNFRIRRVTDVKAGLTEVLKYISKPLDAEKFKVSHLKQVLNLKGQRLFSTFGAFRSFAASFVVPERETQPEAERTLDNGNCPHCSQPLFSIMLGIHGLIELEKFIAEQKRYDSRAHAPPQVLGVSEKYSFRTG